jgi:GNAT superfamily N-acetyltransferase
MDPLITTRAERPEFGSDIWEMPDSWPEFMDHDPIAWSLYSVATAAYPELTVVATDGDGSVVGHGQATAFRLDLEGRRELPDTGWDQVLMWVSSDLRKGVEPDVASALEVSVHPDWQGRGLSTLILTAMRDAARARGFDTLLAPVRPSGKHLEPATPMSEYAYRTRADGLPEDPWLRIHVRAGGVIEKIAPASMVVGSSLANWRGWTGLPFDVDGPVEVPYALSLVHSAPEHDHAVYVEPNVWVRHRL